MAEVKVDASVPPAAASRKQPKVGALFQAIREELPGFAPDTVFDVGANVGGTAVFFARAFPSATIYAFEPVAETFQVLVERTRAHAGVRAFNLALGRKRGRARMLIRQASVANRVARWRDSLKPSVPVTMTNGDAFCAEHRIARIGFLKIDTEGHDLEVLRGFRSLLQAHRIDLLEAEVSMNPENRRHVRFEKVKAYLERRGYRLFLIYEQAREIAAARKPMLRRVNAVFLSPKLIGSRAKA
jgi:FkbM family methyltransferase